MNPTDGIETLLHVDDPMERRLALKSKAVQPSHLRLALQDEDPHVRAYAARHAALTPELIREVLNGNDDWLKHVILERPDLRPEDLEPLVEDPGFSDELYQHPSCTPEQKERLNGLPAIAERQLAKNIGYVTFPELGEGKTHHAGAYYPEQGYTAHKAWLRRQPGSEGDVKNAEDAATHYNVKQTQPIEPHRQHMSLVARKPGEAKRLYPLNHVPFIESVRNRIFGDLPREDTTGALGTQFQPTLKVIEGKVANANEAHEVQHGVFARLAQRYGDQGRNRILQSLMDKLPNEDRNTIIRLFTPVARGYHEDDHAEEAITHLHNYLMDPLHRRRVNVNQRIHNKLDLQKLEMKRARQAWNALVRAGKHIKAEDAGLVTKSDPALVEAWVQNLRKSREYDPSSLEDHLGHDGQTEAALEGVRFMIGKPVDPAIFRARLIDHDGDAVQAALEAAGLTSEDRPALEAILKLRGVAKAQEGAHTVEPLLPDADEAAQMLGWAFTHNDVEPVHLGGKHSKGTLLAHDEDGNLLLVKPGSGKQSPALGAAQETASQSRREAAFSAVARAWGMAQFVPRADLVRVDNRETAVIRMLGLNWTGLHRAKSQNPGLPRQVLKKYLDDGTLHRWAVMDWVLGNPDRHGNNLMVGPEPEHNVGLIDHGSAFAGPAFSPGRDSNSFVPYYLRVWGPGTGWAKLSPEQKAAALPTVSAEIDQRLYHWVNGLDAAMLASILHRYGIDPEPTINRLRTVKSVVNAERPSAGINRLWLG